MAGVSEQLGNMVENSLKPTLERHLSAADAVRELVVRHETQVEQVTSTANDLERLHTNDRARGNLAELQLSNILRSAGLEKDRDFRTQRSNSLGGIPDTVVFLSHDAHVIIDSKSIGTAYTEFVNTPKNASDRVDSGKRYLKAVDDSAQKLASKGYNSRDDKTVFPMVLMFVHYEGAVSALNEIDKNFWLNWAQRNIVIVSPAELISVLATLKFFDQQQLDFKRSSETTVALQKFRGWFESQEAYEKTALTHVRNAEAKLVQLFESRRQEMNLILQQAGRVISDPSVSSSTASLNQGNLSATSTLFDG